MRQREGALSDRTMEWSDRAREVERRGGRARHRQKAGLGGGISTERESGRLRDRERERGRLRDRERERISFIHDLASGSDHRRADLAMERKRGH